MPDAIAQGAKIGMQVQVQVQEGAGSALMSCQVVLGRARCRRKLLPVFVFVVDLALIIPRCARPFWSVGPAQLWSSPAFRSASQSLNPGLRPKSLVASLGCPYMPDGSCVCCAVCRVRCDAATTLALTTTDADALRALPLHRPCLGRPAEQRAYRQRMQMLQCSKMVSKS